MVFPMVPAATVPVLVSSAVPEVIFACLRSANIVATRVIVSLPKER